MKLTVSCCEVGMDCDCDCKAEIEEKIMKTAKVYAMRDHRYQIEDLMTPELRENIKFDTKDLNFIIFLLLRNLKQF